MNRCVLLGLWICVSIIILTSTTGAVYDGISYQGKLMVNDSPFDGSGSFLFAIVDESSTLYLWSNDGVFPPETPETVTVDNGFFNVILGEPDMEPLMSTSLLEQSDLVLRIWFDDGTNGMQQLLPDQKLTSAIFSGRSTLADTASEADTVDGYHYSVLWPTTLTTVKAAASNDFHNLGGTDDDIPDFQEVSTSAIQDNAVTADKLAHNIDATGISFDADMVDGMDATDFATTYHNHRGDTWTGSGTGLELSGGTTGLRASGSSYGLRGETSSSTGYGVYGETNATSGGGIAIMGYSSVDNATAIYGETTVTDTFTRGVYGRIASTQGYAVLGSATATSGTTNGVRGITQASRGAGVYGESIASTGITQGVYGYAQSNEGKAIYGSAASTSG